MENRNVTDNILKANCLKAHFYAKDNCFKRLKNNHFFRV